MRLYACQIMASSKKRKKDKAESSPNGDDAVPAPTTTATAVVGTRAGKQQEETASKQKAPRRESIVSRELGSGSKRHMVICMELRCAFKSGWSDKSRTTQRFEEVANYQGAVRYILGSALNYQLAQQSHDPPKINKSLIDRTWSAIELWRTNQTKALTREEPEYRSVCKFLTATNMDLTLLPPKCLFDLRQRTADDIRVNCVSHIALSFESRVRGFAKHLLTNIEEVVIQYPCFKDRTLLVNRLVKHILQTGQEEEEGYPTELQDYRQDLDEFVTRGRQCVRNLIVAATKPSDQTPKSLAYALKSDTHLAIPFLAWISQETERKWRLLRDLLVTLPTLPKSERKPFFRAESGARKCRYPPKTFSLAPSYRLQPCFVDYCSTEVSKFFGFHNKDTAMRDVSTRVFDLSTIPQMKKGSMQLLGFRTDGFTLEVKLVALAKDRPYSPNTDKLPESGYDLPEPKRRVDVLTQPRGIYRITQTRYDNQKLRLEDSFSSSTPLSAVTVDPGAKKPVCVRCTPVEHSGDATSILNNSTVWDVTSQEYRKMAGYDISRRRDRLRRQKNKRYRIALKDMRKYRKKSAVPATIVNQAIKVGEHLKVFLKEKLHRQRSKVRRVHQKKRQSTLARIGSWIAQGCRSRRTSPSSSVSKCSRYVPKRKRVVFYGDGHFRPPKGCVAMPWKKLAHAVSCRALTFATSEHRTSCACPGCTNGHMQDVEKGSRIRRCDSSPLTPDNPCIFSTRSIDRDEVATISMTLVANRALLSHSRPQQFCYRQQQQQGSGPSGSGQPVEARRESDRARRLGVATSSS